MRPVLKVKTVTVRMLSSKIGLWVRHRISKIYNKLSIYHSDPRSISPTAHLVIGLSVRLFGKTPKSGIQTNAPAQPFGSNRNTRLINNNKRLY